MAVVKKISDVLRECHQGRKTGAVVVSVAEASENLIRFYFQEGKIYSISYGTAKDRDCLDIVECYTPANARFLEGMKIPAAASSLPDTAEIIAIIERTGKQVQTDR